MTHENTSHGILKPEGPSIVASWVSLFAVLNAAPCAFVLLIASMPSTSIPDAFSERWDAALHQVGAWVSPFYDNNLIYVALLLASLSLLTKHNYSHQLTGVILHTGLMIWTSGTIVACLHDPSLTSSVVIALAFTLAGHILLTDLSIGRRSLKKQIRKAERELEACHRDAENLGSVLPSRLAPLWLGLAFIAGWVAICLSLLLLHYGFRWFAGGFLVAACLSMPAWWATLAWLLSPLLWPNRIAQSVLRTSFLALAWISSFAFAIVFITSEPQLWTLSVALLTLTAAHSWLLFGERRGWVGRLKLGFELTLINSRTRKLGKRIARLKELRRYEQRLRAKPRQRLPRQLS